MRRWLTLDRLPGIGMVVLLLASLWLADTHVHDDVIADPSPFVPVWAVYRRSGAVRLVSAAVVGTLVGLVVPMARPVQVETFVDAAARGVRPLMRWWLATSIGCLAVALLAKGPYYLDAPHYLAFWGPAALSSLAGIVMPLGMLTCGMVSVKWPAVGALLALGTASVMFSCATRVFAGSLLLFAMGRLFAGHRVGSLTWLGSVASVFALLPVPLFCRGFNRHGLIPYAMQLVAIDPNHYWQMLPTMAADNLGFTVPLLQYVVREPNITLQAMAVQVNPLPASMAGWGHWMPLMRVHLFIPYSMLGEFGHFGLVPLAGACFLWCVLVRLSLQLAATNGSRAMVVIVVAQMVLGLLAMVQMTQYNTRSVFRLFDLMVFACVADLLTRRWQHRFLG